MRNFRFTALGGIILFAFLVPYTSATVYWRDSGEFLLSAFYLDVAHPPGFPLYSILANQAANLPIGPAAWRINLFSTFIFVVSVCLAFAGARLLYVRHLGLRPRAALMFALLAPLTMLLTPAFQRQALLAEVYVLNCVVMQIVVLLYLGWLGSRDLRYILLSGFVLGLGLANHISLALFALGFAFLLLTDLRAIKTVILPGILFGLMGLSVYAYMPLRAGTALSLNTGSTQRVERFFDHLTDRRDREIRPQIMHSLSSNVESGLFTRIISSANKDLSKLRRECSEIVLLLALLGLLLISSRCAKATAILVLAAASNWIFFMGWDSDPWLPLLWVLAILAPIPLALTGVWISNYRLQRVFNFAVPAVFAALLLFVPHSKFSLLEYSQFSAPERSVSESLSKIPQGGIAVIEASWFVAKYLRDIEGYRSDVALVYQPRLLFPNLFARVQLDSGNDAFDSWKYLDPTQDDAQATFRPYTELLDMAARVQSPVVIEPNVQINALVKNVVNVDASGLVSLIPGKATDIDPVGLQIQLADWSRLRSEAAQFSKQFQNDTRNYVEVSANAWADLLGRAGHSDYAQKLLENICAPLESNLCSAQLLNNLASLKIEAGKFKSAAEILLWLYQNQLGPLKVIKDNLVFALSSLEVEQLEAIRSEESWREVLLELGF